jgi:hypothetical protein
VSSCPVDLHFCSRSCTRPYNEYLESLTSENCELVRCAAKQAAAYICDGSGSSEEAASATASAYAAAVASVVAECVLAGDASASVKATADARAKAEVWVLAYFDAVAQASDCEKCEAWAASWGYIEKWVFLEAIAQAEVNVCYHLAKKLCILLPTLHPSWARIVCNRP